VGYEFRQVPLVLELVARAGGRADGLLAFCGLPEAAATDASVTARVEQFEQLLGEAARRARTPAFGLALVAAVPRGRFGWLEFASRLAPTLDDAYPLVARYTHLISSSVSFAYSCTDDVRTLVLDGVGHGPQLPEFILAYVLGVSREVVGKRWSPERVWFTHRTPSDADAVAAYFGCKVSYGAKSTGMTIPAAIAATRFLGHDPALLALLQARLAELAPAPALAVTARTNAEIASRIGRGSLAIEDIARSLGTSARSLQRGLAAEGASFAAMVEDARRVMAEALVTRKDLTIEQIAAMLGYESLRGFDRAFKRWTGKAPTTYRGRQR